MIAPRSFAGEQDDRRLAGHNNQRNTDNYCGRGLTKTSGTCAGADVVFKSAEG